MATAPRNDEQEPIAPGDRVDGRYRIEARLGGGGMATVYRAHHEVLDRPVALKVVADHVRRLPGISERFLREARAATKLRSEHVVRVFDVGQAADGRPYMAMELLEGRDLDALLAEAGPLPVTDAVDYVLQTCEALAEVHGAGIVHRDLKPANLFLTHGLDGRPCVKLIDFGVSRLDAPLSEGTQPNVIVGSPRYMSPEQMESAAKVDARSDIWSVGVVLYELLTGEAPFDGESYWDLYLAVMDGVAKRPSARRRDVPRALDDVILRCLSTDPTERFADVAALGAALAPFGGETGATRAATIARVLAAAQPRVMPSVPRSRVQRRVRPTRRERRLERATWALLGGLALVATAAGAQAYRGMRVAPAASVAAPAADPAPAPTREPPAPAPPPAPEPSARPTPRHAPPRRIVTVTPAPSATPAPAPTPAPSADEAEDTTPAPREPEPTPAPAPTPSGNETLFEDQR